MAKKTTLLDLQFDQYSRQNIMTQLVAALRSDKQLKILDVGGHLGNTKEFFAQHDVTVIDLYDETYKGYVKGSALDMPFEADSFDVVFSFDVFEHIAEKDRKQVLTEMLRVSSDVVAIAAPFDTELVAQTELQSNALYKALYGEDHPWLIEHIDNGLPKLNTTLAFFDSKKVDYRVYASNNVFLWKLMISFLFIGGGSRLPKLHHAINRYYNENARLLGDYNEPSYRKVIFASQKNSLKKLPDLTSAIDSNKYNQLLEMITSGMGKILSDKQLSLEQAHALEAREAARVIDEKNDRIAVLETEIREIRESRTWKTIQNVSKIKNINKR